MNWEQLWIKPEVAVCIAFADTSLWKAMKTKNNIGNVWNNDRWDKVHLSSIYVWITAIYQTLNNKYLSKYDTLGMLSQWGRTALRAKWCGEKWEQCYATSPDNWNNNIINCLNLIHWHEDKKIDENFLFRTTTNE